VESLRRWCSANRPFVLALAVGAGLRVIVSVAFAPGLVYSDGPIYLDFLRTLVPYPDRPDGYGLALLYPLSLVTDRVIGAATDVQHVLGLATACVLYVMLRRWAVPRRAATLATLPVLFDSLQLVLEQSIFSDTLFVLLVLLAIACLGWRRRITPRLALAAGLLLGAAVTVRLVGEPLLVVAVAFCLLVGSGWRHRAVTAVALVAGFAVPVVAYATYFHHEHGVYALSRFGGKSLWLRSTSFVNCSSISVPRYQRVLCPRQPLGERRDPTYYGWHDPTTEPRLRPPPGTTREEAMRQFALAAIRAQPLDYARVVIRDFALNFDVARVDRYEFDTAYKWHFSHYVRGWAETGEQRQSYRRYDGRQMVAREPFAYILAGYSWVVYLPGPVLLSCLVLGWVGGLGLGRAARDRWTRSMCLLLTASGTVLLLVPDLTAEFIWRYQLPALVLLPAGAALALGSRHGDEDAITADGGSTAQLGAASSAGQRLGLPDVGR
jgi:hypothetical protein